MPPRNLALEIKDKDDRVDNMLHHLRQLQRILEPEQNDYFAAVQERIFPIKGKTSLGDYLPWSHIEDGCGVDYGFPNGDGIGSDPYKDGAGYLYGTGYGNGIGYGATEYGTESGDGLFFFNCHHGSG